MMATSLRVTGATNARCLTVMVMMLVLQRGECGIHGGLWIWPVTTLHRDLSLGMSPSTAAYVLVHTASNMIIGIRITPWVIGLIDMFQ